MLTQNGSNDPLSRFNFVSIESVPKSRYQPLHSSKNEIRVLHVCWAPYDASSKWRKRLSQLMSVEDKAGMWKDGLKDVSRSTYSQKQPVQCWLETVSLDFHPDFTALSYAWGSSFLGTRKIILNGSEAFIGVNLDGALRQVRQRCFDHGQNYTTIWADALCINQNDDKEKSYQVNMMRNIFARAKMTIAWLGDSTTSDGKLTNYDVAMTTLEQIGESARERGARKALNANVHDVLTEDDFEHLAKRAVRELRLATDLHSGPKKSPALEALWALTDASWWQRVWVVQEIAVSRHVFLACGRHLLPWETVDAAITVLKQILVHQNRMTRRTALEASYISAHDHQVLLNVISSAAPFCEARRRFQKIGMNQSLKDILRLTCTVGSELIPMRATDDRDKVFALLGLANDSQALGISANYTMQYTHLCTTVAMAFMQHGTIDILSYCRHFKPHPESTDSTSLDKRPKSELPSWVPDWAAGVPETLQSDEIQFSASKGRELSHSLTELPKRGMVLGLEACFIDEIETAFAPFPTGDGEPRLRDIRAWVRKVQEEFEDHSYVGRDRYGSSKRRNRALWKTTIADHGVEQDGTVRRASTNNYQAYCVLMGLDAPHNAFEADDYKTRYVTESSIYKSALMRVMKGRRLFLTKSGFLGLGPEEYKLGDVVCIIAGSDTPHLLREAGKGAFRLVGELYVHGLMDGEIMKAEPEWRSLKLV